MIFSSFAGGYGGLPPLPGGLLPIANGGRYVMTNAFEGNFGAPFVWQYNSRIYQLSQ